MRLGTLSIRQPQVAAPLAVGLLAAGLGMGLLWATDSLEGKWLIALLVGLVVPWVILMSRDLERFLLFSLVFFLPFNANVNFGWKGDEITAAGAKGLSLSILDVAMAVLYVIWLVKLLTGKPEDRRIRMVPSISLPFGLLVLWSGLSILRAIDPVLSAYQLVQLGKVWLIFLYLANNVRDERRLRLVGVALCAGILVQGLLVFAQYFLGTTFNLGVFGETRRSIVLQETGDSALTRVGGTFGHPNRLAVFVSSTLPIVIALWLSGTSRWLTMMAGLTFLVEVSTLVLTFSRGGWATTAFLAPLVVLLGAWKRGGLRKALGWLIISGFLMSVAVLPFAGPITQRLFETDYGRGLSRLAHVQIAGNMISSHPILGVGLNNYTLAMGQYDNTLERITLNIHTPVHNAFLLTAAEVGLLGLLFFLWLMTALLGCGWQGFRKGRGMWSFFCLGLAGGMAGFLLHSLVEPRFARTDYCLALFMGLVGAAAVWGRPPLSAKTHAFARGSGLARPGDHQRRAGGARGSDSELPLSPEPRGDVAMGASR